MIRPAEPDLRPSGCDCDNCRGGDLPATPFLAPRVAHGMLLGEDDFRYLIGYPRGKHLLHQAWLHGAGVVWGYPVRLSGLNYLVIAPYTYEQQEWAVEVCQYLNDNGIACTIEIGNSKMGAPGG